MTFSGGTLNVFAPLTLGAAAIAGGFIYGVNTTISTTPAAPAFFLNCEFTAGLTVASLGNDIFQSVRNHGLVTTTVGMTPSLDNFTNLSSGRVTIGGALVAQFTSNGQMTAAGTITAAGVNPLTFGGGSVTNINGGGTVNVASLGAYVAVGLANNAGNFGGTGTITVDFNGRVQGAGTFGSVVTQNGGVFAPGASPGTATTNQFNINGGGRLEFVVTDASGTPGNVTGWDLINVQPTVFSATGLMNYTSSLSDKYIIQLKSRLDDGIGNTPDNIDNFNGALNYAWKFADGSNINTSCNGAFNASNFQIDTTDFSTPSPAASVSNSATAERISMSSTRPSPGRW